MLGVKPILIFVPLGHLALGVKLHLHVVGTITDHKVRGHGYPLAALPLFVDLCFGHDTFV